MAVQQSKPPCVLLWFHEKGEMAGMKEWWEKKKRKSRKRKKQDREYTFWDAVFDVLLWLPELLFFPFRLLFWLVRGAGRMIGNIFDFI